MNHNQATNEFVDKRLKIESVSALLDHARWSLRLTWQSSARLMLGSIGIVAVRGVLPALLAIVARNLINGLVATLDDPALGFSLIWPWFSLSLALAVSEVALASVDGFLKQRLQDDLNVITSVRLLEHGASLDVAYFESASFQDLLSRAGGSMGMILAQITASLLTLTTSLIQIVSLVVVLALIEPWFTLVSLLFILPYFAFQWYMARRRYDLEYGRTTRRRWTAYFHRLVLHHTSVPEVKLLNLYPHIIDRYRHVLSQFRDQNRRLYWVNLVGTIGLAVVTSLSFYAVLARVIWRVVAGGLTVGDVVVYTATLARLRGSIQGTAQILGSVRELLLTVGELRAYLDTRSQMMAPTVTSVTLPEIRSSEMKLPKSGVLRLCNVSFSYPGSKREVLRDISLTVQPGETIALVGENGAGKTTLAKLIARLYDPTAGAIYYGDIDLCETMPNEWYSHISFVFQQFNQYEATAAETIAYGDWERLLPPDERVKVIARMAGADQIIEGMPEGYDTLLGRMFGDYRPSTGQWQKLAVARAFAREQSSIVILDEPTAHLDAQSEYELFQQYQELAAGRTTILISHRLSTVSLADRIYVLEDGGLLEEGTHAELLAQNGVYAAFCLLHSRDLFGQSGH